MHHPHAGLPCPFYQEHERDPQRYITRRARLRPRGGEIHEVHGDDRGILHEMSVIHRAQSYSYTPVDRNEAGHTATFYSSAGFARPPSR